VQDGSDRSLQVDLAKRKRQVLVGLVFSALFLVLLNAGAWLRYVQTKARFEALHGQRLLAVARTTAQGLGYSELQLLHSPRMPETWEVQHRLEKIGAANDLGALFVVDGGGAVLLDTRTPAAAGGRFTHLGPDTTACRHALNGHEALGELHRIAGELFRVAAVPIWITTSTGDRDIGAALGVDAAASYLSVLDSQRRSLLFFGFASLLGLVAVVGGLARSVTALIRAQDALREAEQLSVIGRLAPAIAHEIRNPLEIIKGSADVIRRKYGASADIDELFTFIPAEVSRIDRLIAGFLSLARPLALSIEAVDAVELVRRVVVGLQARFEESAIDCHIESPDGLPRVAADPDRLQQVVLNLVVNAAASLESQNPNQERQLRIVATACTLHGRDAIELAVEDNGPGIAKEHRVRIFEPFFTTRGAKGTGLGLAVTRRIVRDHGGEIELDESCEGGARFSVRLPAI